MTPQDFTDFANAILAVQATAPTAKTPTAKTPAPNANALAAKVDRLGAINAAMAAMKDEADLIRAELEAAGLERIEGQIFRASFAQVAGKTLTDWATIAKRFSPSAQLIRAYTKTGKESIRMTIKARTGA